MSIVWPKFLDEIIAGLPTNSQQRLEIGKLKERVQALEAENAKLKNELRAEQAATKQDNGFPAETAKVLKEFFDADREYSAEGIAFALNLESSIARYHMDLLLKHRLIQPSRALMNRQTEYKITAAGRAFIVENDLM